ncbi:MAG: T9SS type A sorting domain-containing protein [Ignavibacteriae bacterium]|nr:T9SS type A sorting domain-containing protein [Ignavibacteriota bacterium]
MRARAVIVFFFILILGISNWNYGQDSNKVYYKIFMEKSNQYGTFPIKIDEGLFKEGDGFVIPESVLPSFPYNFTMFQDLYDALVGGFFRIDHGALDKDIILKLYISNLDSETGTYKPEGEDSDTLFAYFEIRIWELPDSTYSPDDLSSLPDSSFYSEDMSYYFNENKYARLTLPKTDKFMNFLDTIGIARDDSLSFAFLQYEDWDSNSVKTNGWNGDGIEIIDGQDSITFKAIHLSKVGGGRGRIHKDRDSNDPTGIYGNLTIPNDFNLEQNYPNPFNPETKIRYSIPNSAGHNNTFVKLDVYNVLGKKVKTLINENQRAGNYEVSFDASELASGIYIYSLQSNNLILTRKMIVLK